MAPRVAVIGDAVLDVHVRPSGPIRPGGDVPAAIGLGPGGQGANVAVRLARRGVTTRLACALGGDTAGRILRDALAADGVEAHDLGADATGAVVALVDPDGERTMLSQRVPLSGRLDPAALSGAEWLVVSGYVLLEGDSAADAVMHGIAERTMILGCSLAGDQASAWADAAARLRPALTVLNEAEASAIAASHVGAGELPTELGARLSGLIVVTTADGAHAALGSELVSVIRPPRDAAVDTTGAGDELAATLLASLLGGAWPPDVDRLRTALESAVTAAGEVTRVRGAQGRIAGERGARLRA